jgi:hypothetical protein
MKAKTIDRACRRAMEHWMETLPNELQQAVMENLILTGGSIANLFLGEPVNDWDVYLRTKETAKAIAEHYVKLFVSDPPKNLEGNPLLSQVKVLDRGDRIAVMVQSAGVLSAESGEGNYQYFEAITDTSPETTEEYVRVVMGSERKKKADKDYFPGMISGNAITLLRKNAELTPMQIILRFVGDPAEIHKNFDWCHATNYWTFKDGLVTNTDALECLLAKELRYVGSQYPLAALLRSYKFVTRGFTRPHAGHMLVITQQLAQLNWEDPAVWEDQLMGVDFAYFREIIARIRTLLKEGKGMQEIISTYLAQVVEETI